MNPILKNVLGVIAGAVIGSIVNMAIVMIGSSIVPPPEGVISGDMESIKANIDSFQFQHYIMPFLAHALGTLVGALVAVKIGASHKMILALIIGVLFLVGGIMAVMSIGGSTTFAVVDLVFAYIPMAWLGHKLGTR